VSNKKIAGKLLRRFSFGLCLTAWFFIWPKFCLAENNHLIISEVAAQIEIGKAESEFIEIYNPTDSEIDMTSFKLFLVDSSNSKTEKKKITYTNNKIKASGFFLFGGTQEIILNNKKVEMDAIYSNGLTGTSGVILEDKDGNIIDRVGWGEATAKIPPSKAVEEIGVIIDKGLTTGKSIGRNTAENDTDNNSADFIVYSQPTPGEKNIIPSEPEPIEYPAGIFLNEILPNPKTGCNEFIEFYNNEKTEVNLKGWHLQDSSTGKIEFKYAFPIAAGNYKYIEKTKDYTSLTLNDDKDSLALFDPNGKIISVVNYTGAKDGISYNFDGVSWRWSRFLTPGAENIFNNLPSAKTKNPKKGYVNTYVEFSAKGSDADGDKLKYAWDFGDGHKSYKKETRHKYEKAKKYKVILKISDGSEDKIKTFKIEIKKYPKLDINIVAVVPNPAGKDTTGEYLTLENRSKKRVNLKDWVVATGGNKLYNHPITEDLFIKPGEKLKLTRDISKFSLNNKKAEVELRYPGGKLASHVSYSKGTASAQDDEIYQKTGTVWAWVAPDKNIPSEKNPPTNIRLVKAEDRTQMMLGKFSDGPLIAKKQNKIILASYAVNLKNVDTFYPAGGKVAGAYAAAGDNFIFTSPPALAQSSQNFWAKLFAAFNSFINGLIRQN